MYKPKRFYEIITISDYLNFKYKNPSYGGDKRIQYESQRRDDEVDDLVLMSFVDSETKKIYFLWVQDVEVWISNRYKLNETFHINVSVTNFNQHKSDNGGKKIINTLIMGRCISPFKGEKPTEYSNVQCMFDGADLSIFD